jgi:SOS-response transcriptional repressor LexA
MAEIQTEVLQYMLRVGHTVGAGSSVVQFPYTNNSFINLTLPPLPIPAKDAIIFPVSGNSLAADRVFDGDLLIANTKFSKTDIRAGKICIVLLYGVEFLAKRVHFEADGSISLCSRGEDGKMVALNADPEQVEILGIVIMRVGYMP